MLIINKELLQDTLKKMVAELKTGAHDSETTCLIEFDGIQIQLKVTCDQDEFIDVAQQSPVANLNHI